MTRIVTPKITNDSWLNISTLPGFNINSSYIIENISKVIIRVFIGEDPANIDKDSLNIISPNEQFYVQSGLSNVFLIADSIYSDGIISLTSVDKGDLRPALRKLTGLNDPRLLTIAMTQTEGSSIDGRLYQAIIDITVPSGANAWVDFVVPTGANCAVVGFNITPFYTGMECRTYYNSTGKIQQTAITPISLNKAVSVTPNVSVRTLTAPPTTIGSLYDIPIFIPANGTNPAQRAAASASRESGYQVFPGNSSFQYNLINSSGNANRVILKVVWIEIAPSAISS